VVANGVRMYVKATPCVGCQDQQKESLHAAMSCAGYVCTWNQFDSRLPIVYFTR
jgi:hypothetical protein